MTEELIGKTIGEWFLLEYAGAGKSAIVFKAKSVATDQMAALKVFDPELIERFGKEIQTGRIERELTLRGKHHPNLVKILDGGECSTTGYFYVAMEFVDAPNLASLIDRLPRDQIWPIISQLAEAARFLEGLGLAHRDIKPENVALGSDLKSAILLDLGVIRPVGLGDLTDEAGKKPFIGTLRYGPPEMLIRSEEDTIKGWRAITFYQIGAVLHDLIMRRLLFSEYGEPFALLVDAVRNMIPSIEAPDVSPDLILLAKNCLVKDPNIRLSLISWSDFQVKPPVASAVAAKARMEKRLAASQINVTEAFAEEEQKTRSDQRIIADILGIIERILRQECAGNALIPPFELAQSSTPGYAEIKVCFGKSTSLGLSRFALVWLSLELLSGPDRVIEVKILAGISKNRIFDESTDGLPYKVIFRGVFQELVLEQIIRNLLYTLIDQAQQHCDSTVTMQGAIDPIWFTELLDASLESK